MPSDGRGTSTSHAGLVHAVDRSASAAAARLLQLQAHSEQRVSELQSQAASREAQLQEEFGSLSTEMLERIEQLQGELQGLQEYKQQKVRTCGNWSRHGCCLGA